jgi:hypothetical protein
MTSAMSQSQVAHVALQSIGRAIEDLSKPIGTGTTTSAFGSLVEDIYRIGPQPQGLRGVPPHTWPEVIAVTEALIGAAFAVAQAHLRATGKRNQNIDGVANYWKHRDEWCQPWGSGTEQPRAGTLQAITTLGATPPIVPGQLQRLASSALGGAAFDVELLWAEVT